MSLHVSDFEKSKDFYTKVLKTVGYEPHMEFPDACGFKESNDTNFWLVKNELVPTHVAFIAKDKGGVEAFYKTALELGGKDNGAPGYRPEYWVGYYGAFVLDPDGHNIEAVWYDYEKAGELKE